MIWWWTAFIQQPVALLSCTSYNYKQNTKSNFLSIIYNRGGRESHQAVWRQPHTSHNTHQYQNTDLWLASDCVSRGAVRSVTVCFVICSVCEKEPRESRDMRVTCMKCARDTELALVTDLTEFLNTLWELICDKIDDKSCDKSHGFLESWQMSLVTNLVRSIRQKNGGKNLKSHWLLWEVVRNFDFTTEIFSQCVYPLSWSILFLGNYC